VSTDAREATARRIRAARIVAGLTVEELAAKMHRRGLGTKTLGKIERVERDAAPHELEQIAEATNVPLWFLRHGFDGQAIEDEAEPTARERLDALEGEVEALRTQHRELREAREQITALAEQVTTLQRGIAEAVAEHVEDAVSQLVAGPHDASDASPRDEREAER
jgi:transcriptional regulator with XRE-family HTH domain